MTDIEHLTAVIGPAAAAQVIALGYSRAPNANWVRPTKADWMQRDLTEAEARDIIRAYNSGQSIVVNCIFKGVKFSEDPETGRFKIEPYSREPLLPSIWMQNGKEGKP